MSKLQDERDGSIQCQVCHEHKHRTEAELYYNPNMEQHIEICTQCREEFEDDHHLTLDSDVLSGPVYKQLDDWVAWLGAEPED